MTTGTDRGDPSTRTTLVVRVGAVASLEELHAEASDRLLETAVLLGIPPEDEALDRIASEGQRAV